MPYGGYTGIINSKECVKCNEIFKGPSWRVLCDKCTKLSLMSPSGRTPEPSQHEPGAKLDQGKILAAVLGDFSRALTAVAEVGTMGAKKYTRGGWQSVDNGIERYTDALWRHLLKERQTPLDDESGLKHAAHMAWNALARLELEIRKEDA